MTIEQLIAKLKALPADTEVFTGYLGVLNPLDEIVVGQVQLVRLIDVSFEFEKPYDIWCEFDAHEHRGIKITTGVCLNPDMVRNEDNWKTL